MEMIDGLLLNGLSISIVTYGEVYEGVYRSRDPDRAEAVSSGRLPPTTREAALRFLGACDLLRMMGRREKHFGGT